MIEPVELKIPSSDGRSILHVMHWRPVGQPRAVLQIAHGMTEHVGRYGEFAAALAEQGIAVIGHDHLGHGKTAGCEEKLGFFAEKNGAVWDPFWSADISPNMGGRRTGRFSWGQEIIPRECCF